MGKPGRAAHQRVSQRLSVAGPAPMIRPEAAFTSSAESPAVRAVFIPVFSAWCVRLASWPGPWVCHSCVSRAANGARCWLASPPCGFPHSIPAASLLVVPPAWRDWHESIRLSVVGRFRHRTQCRPHHSNRLRYLARADPIHFREGEASAELLGIPCRIPEGEGPAEPLPIPSRLGRSRSSCNRRPRWVRSSQLAVR
jgi:hypothetical protein